MVSVTSLPFKPFLYKALEVCRLRTPRANQGQGINYYQISLPPSVDDGVQFLNCSMAGNDFAYAEIRGALFEPQYMKGHRFYGATITDSVFKNHTIRDSSFYKASVVNSWFNNMKIENCDFSGCDLTGNNYNNVTFKDCSFEGAYVYANDSITGRKLIIEGDALLNFLTEECGINYEVTLF